MSYDALGRTLSVTQPTNPHALPAPASWGVTNYLYSGAVVTVTDPAAKWKKFENDALGNLIKVMELNPESSLNPPAGDIQEFIVMAQEELASVDTLGGLRTFRTALRTVAGRIFPSARVPEGTGANYRTGDSGHTGYSNE